MKNLVYVGEAGSKKGNLRLRLLDHLHGSGWQTAFRRKVFEHVLGVPQRARRKKTYGGNLRKARCRITEEISKGFAFKFMGTGRYGDFEIWLIQKYANQLWNTRKYPKRKLTSDFSLLETRLVGTSLVPFSNLIRRLEEIPKEVGVYLIFRIQE